MEVLEDTLATFVPCVFLITGFKYAEVLARSDGDIDSKEFKASKGVRYTEACLEEHS